MKKSLIQNAILAGVLALFATFYFLYEKQLRPKHTAQEEKEKQLISIATTDIQEITLDRKGEAAPGPDGKYMPANWYVAKFRKAGKDWNIVSPVQDAGDGIAIEGMLSALGGARYDRVVDDNPKDLAVFGLVQPRFKIGVRKDDKSPVEEVWIGADTPVGSNTFVKLASSPKVYKVPSSLKYGVDKELKNFRNKNLWNLSRFDVGELEIQGAKGKFILKKNDKDQWSIASENTPASSTEVTKVLNAIVDLKIIDFPNEEPTDLAAYGLKTPLAKIYLVETKNKTRLGMSVGKVGEKVYAKRDDKKAIFQVEKEFSTKIDKGPNDLRSVEMAAFNRFEVKRIKLEHGKDTLELLKEGPEWTMPTEPKVKVDSAKVDQYLASLQDTRLIKYLPERGAGKAETKSPALTVRVFEKKDAGEQEKVVLAFESPKKAFVTVVRTGLDLPFQIREDDFKKLNLTKQAFVKEEVKPPAPAVPTAKENKPPAKS